jgi:hypothetical protein
MDKTLEALQNHAFHLTDETFDFLALKYEQLISIPVPDITGFGFHRKFFISTIQEHRNQLMSEEYIQSRLADNATGTIDHLHAEITAYIAIESGRQRGYTGYALQLLRFTGHLHDSDRSYPDLMIRGEDQFRNDPDDYRAFKVRHARNSAAIARSLADKARRSGYRFGDGFLDDMEYMILNHEKGGKRDVLEKNRRKSSLDPSLDLEDLTDLLTDADSLAYFYANIITNWEECGRNADTLELKVRFMFERMSLGGKRLVIELILHSPSHILGKAHSDDPDINSIRRLLQKICKDPETEGSQPRKGPPKTE